MKKLKKIISVTLLTAIFTTSCGTNNVEVKEGDKVVNNNVVTNKESAENLESIELKVNIVTGNNFRTITYNQADPLELPSGEVVVAGDLKPLWSYIGNELSIEFSDVAIQDQKAVDMIQLEAATGFKSADIFGGGEGGSLADLLMTYGTQGYFVDLNEHMDNMPNFSAYLEDNPGIKKVITAYDGGIYYIPYVAEINNYARVMIVRNNLTELLLDGEAMEEDEVLTVSYEPYWSDDKLRNSTNVIDLQNEAAAANGGKLTAEIARNVLINYINDTYEYTNPSELYIGVDAQYDIDEYVALLRLVKLSPNAVSFNATGEIVEGAMVQPFFVRQSKYREDLLRLANYFGGPRVYGSDAYNSPTARFIIDKNGELQYSFASDDFLETLPYFKNMYAEGLISTEFSDVNNKANFRSDYFGKDSLENHNMFGFATYDWIASTSRVGDTVGILPPLTTTSSDEFVHYIENTRVIKSDGWAISTASTDEAIKRSVLLFDYFFSEKGVVHQTFGTPEMIDETEMFTGPDGFEYPKMGQVVIDNAEKFTSGDYSQFLRDFVGSILPIGYQKSIGFEYQYTNESGYGMWDLYQSKNVLMPSYDSEENYYKLAPPSFSLTDQEIAKISSTNITDEQSNEIFKYITGANDAMNPEEMKQMYIDNGLETFMEQYRASYKRQNN